jgi:aconitate hydratase
MGLNVVQKILKDHLMEGDLVPGNEIAIKIDQTLYQDATGTMAAMEFEAMGVPRVKTEFSVIYIDHKTIQMGFEDADDHTYLRTFAAKHGVYFSKPGNGICHQVHLERFGKPGKTLMGSDSHTPTGGGIGMIAIGCGGLDVSAAMAGLPFYLTCPRVYGVHLTGKLSKWVSAKDVILKLLSILTTKGNVGWMVEYFGPGVKTLSVPERATITNMGAELGVTTSVFPSDDTTREFLKAQDREGDWVELQADADAQYDKVIEINLSELEPMVALPHSPDNVVSVRDVEGKAVDQVCIGSCTNSSYRDLMVVAEISKAWVEKYGKGYAPTLDLVVGPGSKQVVRQIDSEGALDALIDAGIRLQENACGFCIGMGQAPKNDAVSVRTNNRNFYGRSGTLSAGIYLVSPETAVACALTGVITDPRDLEDKYGLDYPEIGMPDRFIIDDKLVLPPAEDPSTVEVYRGPNIVPPESNMPLPQDVRGEVAIKVGDKITTDHIMPAGQRLKYRSNVPKYAEFVFESVDSTFPGRALDNKGKGIHNVIVGGESYGQGSSREHAALCPMYLGVKAVVAKSIERIHRGNLINFGILPLYFENPDDYDKIDQNDKVVISNVRKALLEQTGKLVMKNETKGIDIPLTFNLSDRERKIVLLGGMLNVASQYGGKSFSEIEITE